MRLRNRLVVLLSVCLVVILAILLAACGSEEKKETPKATPTSGAATAATKAPAATATASSGPTPTPKVVERRSRMDSPELAFMPAKLADQIKKWHQDNLKAPDPYKPVQGGIMQFSGQSVPPTWDTTKGTTLSTYFNIIFVSSGLFKPLQNWGDDLIEMRPEGELVEKWDLSGDGKTWTFQVRKNAMWPEKPPVPRREFTADDATYALNIYFKDSVLAGEFPDIERVETVDKYTFRVVGNRPIPNLLLALYNPKMPMFAKECHQTPDCMKNQFIGIGPFNVDKMETGVKTVFKKNPDYFLTDKRSGLKTPYLDGVNWLVVTDPAAAMAAYRTGKLDTSPSRVSDFEDLYKTNPNLSVQIVGPAVDWFRSAQGIYFRLDKPPFNDVRVRRAMSMAIDRDKIGHDLYLDIVAMTYAVPSFEQGFDHYPSSSKQLGPYERYDPAQAKKLLEEAGYGKGLKFTADVAGTFTGAGLQQKQFLAWQDMLKAIGIEMEIKPAADTPTGYGKFIKGDYDVAMLVYNQSIGSRSDWWTYNQFNSKGIANYAKLNDAELDKLTDKMVNLPRPSKERVEVAREIQKWYSENMPFIWGVDEYRYNWLQPWIINPGGNHDTEINAFGIKGLIKAWIDCDAARKYNLEEGRRPAVCK